MEYKAINFLKKLKQLEKTAKFSDLSKAYLIFGEEFFIWERAIKRFKNIVNEKQSIERVNFENIDINSWLSSLNSISMFSRERLVIASELNDLKEKDLKLFLDYLKNPNPDVVLLMFSQKLDKRKKSIKSILAYVDYCSANHPRDNEMLKWINGFALERGKKFDIDSSEFLKLRFSNDLSSIEKEIEKIALFYQDKKTISRKDVEYLCSAMSAGISVFDLFPAFGFRDKKKTLNVLSYLLKAGESPIMLNSMLTKRIKKYILALDFLDEGIDDTSLSSKVGVHRFYLNSFKSELKSFKKNELEKMYLTCLDIDTKLKSSSVNKSDILINGVLKLF